MSIVNDLMKISEWMQEHICDKVLLKLPSDEQAGGDYEYELVHPTAFPLFTPSKDRLPPNVKAPIPSMCIRLKEGEHRQDGINTMRLSVHFATWNPGIHGKDIFLPTDETATDIRSYNQNATAEYQRTASGWMDVYGFMDVALRELEQAEYIADMRIVSEDGIKYGMTSDKDGLDDFYPYWLGWLEFTLQGGIVRNKSYNEFL